MIDLSNTSVLCVDDEPNILNALRRLFLDEPWQPHFAASGPAGLEILEHHPIDLILADYRMPEMDGVEFLRKARAMQPDGVRLILSGFADHRMVISAINEGGIYMFVGKPWEDDELLALIRKLLEKRRSMAAAEGAAGLSQQCTQAAEACDFFHDTIEALPFAVLGIGCEQQVMLANACARELFEGGLIGKAPPESMRPEVEDAVRRAIANDRRTARFPLKKDGRTIGVVVVSTRTKELVWAPPPAKVE